MYYIIQYKYIRNTLLNAGRNILGMNWGVIIIINKHINCRYPTLTLLLHVLHVYTIHPGNHLSAR